MQQKEWWGWVIQCMWNTFFELMGLYYDVFIKSVYGDYDFSSIGSFSSYFR